MKEQPLISVIMPVYNTGEYVDEAIESIVKQDLFNLELFLIDDGSTDNSAEILSKWAAKDSRISVFFQENQGPSAARNTGLISAKGKYIYFMDSDDKLRSDALLSCLNYCEDQNLDFVYFDATVFGNNQNIKQFVAFNYIRTHTVPYIIDTGVQALSGQLNYGEFFSSPCMVVIKKRFLDQHLLKFEEGLLHEDELFSMLLYLQAKRTAYLSEQFFSRRLRPDSIMTSRLKIFNIKCYFKIAEHLLSFVKKNSKNKELVDHYLTNMLNAAVWKAHVLPFCDRLQILFIVVKNWRAYVRNQSLFVLLFKKFTSHK